MTRATACIRDRLVACHRRFCRDPSLVEIGGRACRGWWQEQNRQANCADRQLASEPANLSSRLGDVAAYQLQLSLLFIERPDVSRVVE